MLIALTIWIAASVTVAVAWSIVVPRIKRQAAFTRCYCGTCDDQPAPVTVVAA